MSSENEKEKPTSTDKESPEPMGVYNYLLYSLSLPERALRSTSAMIREALRESTALLVPQAFRDSKTYSSFVGQMLDVLARDVGRVKLPGDGDDEAGSESELENFVARKTVGNFVELAGMATLHLSPLTVLAIVSDVAYGSTAYLKALSDELKNEGVIAGDSTIDSTADLLAAIGEASRTTAGAFDLPPLSIDGMRETIEQTTAAVARVDPTTLIPEKEIGRLWQEMTDVADDADVSLFQVASAMTLTTLDRMDTARRGALSSIRVVNNLFDEHIVDHYESSIKQIQERGLYASLADSSAPYLEAVWTNFSTDQPTITEDLFSGRLAGRAWEGFQSWFTASRDDDKSDDQSDESGQGNNDSSESE